MPADEKKGITVKVDAALHAEVKQYLESRGMTMADFVTLALTDELHPKMQMKEEKEMGNMRTLAFQVPEDLFLRIKGYLQRNNMTQKEFVIGLIERELDREQAVRESAGEIQEESEESEGYPERQGETVPEGISEMETEESGGYAEDQEESATEDSMKAGIEEPEGSTEEQEEGIAEGGPEAESEESEGDVEEEGTTESGMEADSEEMEGPYGAEAGDGESEDENESEAEDEEEDMGFTMGM